MARQEPASHSVEGSDGRRGFPDELGPRVEGAEPWMELDSVNRWWQPSAARGRRSEFLLEEGEGIQANLISEHPASSGSSKLGKP